MTPDWVTKILQGEGLAGVFIFVLLLFSAGLIAYIKSLHTKADKVYGYRLAERDEYQKTIAGITSVLQKMEEAFEERNELVEEQAEIIARQAQAFELLKVTILSQYDNIREHNSASSQAVGAMAESIRVLHATLIENRAIAKEYVLVVNAGVNDLKTELVKAMRDASDKHLQEINKLLGNVTRIEHRRRKSP